MVLENVTALELHLHLGEEQDAEENEVPEPAPQDRYVVETESPMGTVKSVALIAVMVVVSIGISLLATFLARKFGSRGSTDEAEE